MTQKGSICGLVLAVATQGCSWNSPSLQFRKHAYPDVLNPEVTTESGEYIVSADIETMGIDMQRATYNDAGGIRYVKVEFLNVIDGYVPCEASNVNETFNGQCPNPMSLNMEPEDASLVGEKHYHGKYTVVIPPEDVERLCENAPEDGCFRAVIKAYDMEPWFYGQRMRQGTASFDFSLTEGVVCGDLE